VTAKYDDVEVGTTIPPRTYTARRVDLVKYAGASGDFNPIHWNDRFAREVGLPGVIAHGMYTMAQAGNYVSEWAGDPGAVLEFGVRFSAMVPVPDDANPPLDGTTGGASIEVSGVVKEKLGDRKVAVDVVVAAGGAKVLKRARAVVRLP
jgi:acyl dehydratase